MSMILFLSKISRVWLFLIFIVALIPLKAHSLFAIAPEAKETLFVADFEKWPNNLGGQMWVNGGGEPNWDSPVHSWVYGPEIPDFLPDRVHSGTASFRLVNAQDPKNLPWATFAVDLGPITDIRAEPKKIASLDISQYTHLQFWVRGEKGGEKFELSLRDASQREVTLLPLPDGAPSNWKLVQVPLSSIARSLNLTQLDLLQVHFGSSIGNPQGAVLYVDDIAFVGKKEEALSVPIPLQVEKQSLWVADFEGEVSPLGGEWGPFGGASANFNDRSQIHSTLYLPQQPDYAVDNVYRGKGSFRLVNEMPIPRRDSWASLGMNLGPLEEAGQITSRIKAADVSGYRYLLFWAKGKNGGERIKVLFRDRHAPSYLPQYFADPYPQILTKEWQKIVVPLENVSGSVDLTRLVHVGVEFGSWLGNLKGDTVYLDDFVFSNLLSEPH